MTNNSIAEKSSPLAQIDISRLLHALPFLAVFSISKSGTLAQVFLAEFAILAAFIIAEYEGWGIRSKMFMSAIFFVPLWVCYFAEKIPHSLTKYFPWTAIAIFEITLLVLFIAHLKSNYPKKQDARKRTLVLGIILIPVSLILGWIFFP